jgi:hypothetical protein
VSARLEDGLCNTFWLIFSSNKNAPANRKENSIQTICRRMRRLEGFFSEAAKNFELFENSNQNLKI